MKEFSKQHAWFALFVVVIFAAGLGTGLAIGRFGPSWPGGRPGPPGPGRGMGPPLDRLTRELSLTDDQQKRIQVVLQGAGKRFEEFRARNRHEFEALRQQLRDEIARELTPAQQERFRSLVPSPPAPDGAPPMGGPGEPPPGGPPPGPGR